MSNFFGIPKALFSTPITNMHKMIKASSILSLAVDYVGPFIDLFVTFFKFHQATVNSEGEVLATDMNQHILEEVEQCKTFYVQRFASSVEETVGSGNLRSVVVYLEEFISTFHLWFSPIAATDIIKWFRKYKFSDDRNGENPILSVGTGLLIVCAYLVSLIMVNIPRQFFAFLSLKHIWHHFIPVNKTVDQVLNTINNSLVVPFENTILHPSHRINKDIKFPSIDPFYDIFYNQCPSEIKGGGSLYGDVKDETRILRYFCDVVKQWDQIWLPVLNYLRTIITSPLMDSMDKEEMDLLNGGLSKHLTECLTNAAKTEVTYTREMETWINIVHNFRVEYPSLGKKRKVKKLSHGVETFFALYNNSFKSPLKWIKGDYQTLNLKCIDFLNLARNHLERLFPYSETIKPFSHPIYYIPFFDEIQECFIEIHQVFYRDSNNVNTELKDPTYHTTITILINQENLFETLSGKAKIVYTWFIRKQWLREVTSGFNDLFLIRNGECFLDPLPGLFNHLTFWSFFYCLQRLCYTTTLLRTDHFANYQDIFVVDGVRKMGIYTWEDQIKSTYLRLGDFISPSTSLVDESDTYEFPLDSIFDDRLDLHLQRYLTCFLDLADWFLEYLRPNPSGQGGKSFREKITDQAVPLLMMYPFPERDLMNTSTVDVGNYMQQVRLWHDAPSLRLAIIIFVEKGLSSRNVKRSIGKKLYDCCQKSLAMMKYVRTITMNVFMGLMSRRYLMSFKNEHYGFPIIFRPNFASLYWTWRLFFDRKFSDAVYRHNYIKCEKLLKPSIDHSPARQPESGEGRGRRVPLFESEKDINERPIANYSPYTYPYFGLNGEPNNSRGRGRGKTRGRGRGRGRGVGSQQELRESGFNILTEDDEKMWDESVIQDPRLYSFFPRVRDFPASFQSRQKIYEAKNDEQYVKITMTEELNFRKKVYENRGDALIPIANDLLLSFLHQESDLANDVIKEYFIQQLGNQPQYWLKVMNQSDTEKIQYVDSLLETRWKNYFIRTTLLNNVFRFNLDTCIHTVTTHLIETGFVRFVTPWEMDTIISTSLRTLNNQNKITRQFTNFFDNNAYTFRKSSVSTALHLQLEHFMEDLIKRSIRLEQEIYDLHFLKDKIIPLLLLVNERLASVEDTNPMLGHLAGSLQNSIRWILEQNGFMESVNTPLSLILTSNLLLSKFSSVAIDKILRYKVKLHAHINQPLNLEIKHYIWDTIYKHSTPNNPYDASVLGRQVFMDGDGEAGINRVRFIFEKILTKYENDFLFKITKLYEDQISPEKISKLIDLMPNPIPSFKKIHFLMETIYSAYSLQTTPLDMSSVRKIHETMVAKRYKVLSGPHVPYQNMYRVVITQCCKRIASLGRSSTLYGHFYVSYNPIRKVYVCNKKKSKRMNYTSIMSAQITKMRPEVINVDNDEANKTRKKRPVQITQEEVQTLINTDLDIPQLNSLPEVLTGFRDSQSPLLNDIDADAEEGEGVVGEDEEPTLIIPQFSTSKDSKTFFFMYILESNRMGKVLVKAPFHLVDAFSNACTASFDETSSSSIVQDITSKITALTDELSEYIKKPRFPALDEKDQNKIARRLKKIRHLDCINNPPVIFLDGFGKRFFHGRDEKSRKISQHCLKCGNFTSYTDENWAAEYACFNCWLKDLSIHCRCTYCHSINQKIFDANQLDMVRDSANISAEMVKKERAKKISDVLKAQRRERVMKECMRTPQFPLCITPVTRTLRTTVLAKRLNLSQNAIELVDDMERRHYVDLATNDVLVPLVMSRRFSNVPIYYSAHFCKTHEPLNPNLIHRHAQDKKAKYDGKSSNSLTGGGAIRTFMVTASNFNINNHYRISFLSHYFDLLNARKRKTPK